MAEWTSAAHWEARAVPADADRRTRWGWEYPQSLAVYDEYTRRRRPSTSSPTTSSRSSSCMIVGTDLKRVERITGRLTTGRVALGGAAVRALARPVRRPGLRALHRRSSVLARSCRRCSSGVVRGDLGARRLRRDPRPARLLLGHLGGRHQVRGARRAQVGASRRASCSRSCPAASRPVRLRGVVISSPPPRETSACSATVRFTAMVRLDDRGLRSCSLPYEEQELAQGADLSSRWLQRWTSTPATRPT